MNLGPANRINVRLVAAIVRRDLRLAFSNPTGYVFVTLFIFLSAAAAFWQVPFFLNNLANLDQLNAVFPYLLLFFIPALTMGVWAEETRQGTDELLLTLPATDLEIVLGKYLSVVGVYTASLVLSLTHVLVLMFLGSPDLGLMAGNYLGYWLAGAALISAGMLASLLTSHVTIAFILGALFCAAFVLIGPIAGGISDGLRSLLSPLGLFTAFDDFARGVVSFSGLVHFVSVAGLMLYLNVVLIGRRHWPVQAGGYRMGIHHGARAAALVAVVIGLNVILGRAGVRLDVTAEGLHSLSDETVQMLSELDPERPVFIQAFVSPEVPESYVQTRSSLIDVLKELDAVGGSRVQVRIQATEMYTPEAREASERFGITPRELPDLRSARSGFTNVFAGIAVTCGPEEQVIGFLDTGLPVEYELVRSLRVAARADRAKLGILATEVRLFGGFDFNTMQSRQPWAMTEELRKQYDVVQVQPQEDYPDDLDVLLAALPNTLTQPEMDRLSDYIASGNPTLLLTDPLPSFNLALSPSEQKGASANPFAGNQQPAPVPKGDIQGLLRRFGVEWTTGLIVWDQYNPHPGMAHLPPEVVFASPGNENPDTFNQEAVSTASLQELVFIFPGRLQHAGSADFTFTPLVQSGIMSGLTAYSQLVQRNFFGGSQLVLTNIPRRASQNAYTVAAHVTGNADGTAATDDAAGEGAVGTGVSTPVNLVVVADVDFASQQFFDIRRMGAAGLSFDNVTFFLNLMDVLVGDESFIALRSKRVRYRTLETVERQTMAYTEQRVRDEDAAEEEAQAALDQARRRLTARVDEVRQRTDLDEQTRRIMVRNLEEVENRRFETLQTNIEAEKEARIQESKEMMESQVRLIQNTIKNLAALLPPVPVFLLGVFIFLRRRRRENEAAAAARRLRS
ncbi:MAG: ABC transporter [Gemmatimonadetes bacterium]|nr:ABC transporter [Gemmatimonadota bacterium]MYD26604.1 ABC transporter [Gemmatimonadota bacterium]